MLSYCAPYIVVDVARKVARLTMDGATAKAVLIFTVFHVVFSWLMRLVASIPCLDVRCFATVGW